MRILYDHQIFARQKYGGISRYFTELIRLIPTFGRDRTELFAPFHINEYAADITGIRLPHFPGAGLTRRIGNAILARTYVKQRRSVDIFHETYYSNTDVAPARAQRVVTVYDMIHERFPEYFPREDRTSAVKRQAVLRADHVICISESTRRDLLAMIPVPIEKTSIIHLGFALSNNDTLTKSLPDFGKPYLLYVGQRGGYKNFQNLLRAYARSRTLSQDFALVCFGGGQALSSERALIESLGIQASAVFFVGGDDKFLSKLYSSAAAFVYPSLYEGFGIPPLEAMSHGCPVACANTSSLPEVVGDAAEFFDPASLDDMQAALERVVTSVALAQLLISRGHRRIADFSWEKCARETLTQYQRLLDIKS